ncbi:mannosyltransferase, partial [Spiromyces aspiralis]
MDRTLSGQQRDSLRRRPPYRETCSRSGSNQGGATDHKAQSDQRVGRAERYGKSVAVVVLGDIGRSPRMQYHAMSLAENGFNVDLIGYKGSPKALFLLYAPIKILYQLAQLLWLMLFAIRRPSHILVQNPPAIPTLAIAYLVAVIRRSQLVVDWHNYGYTILGLKLGTHHPVVRVAE